MKKILILSLLASFQMQAQVLWYGDPDKAVNTVFSRFDAGNYPQDACSGGDATTPSSVTTVNDPVYGKVWRIYKPKKRKRGEFARTSYVPKENETLYYGWRWKITASPDITGGIAVFQWKTDAGGGTNTQNYPMNLGYGGGKLTMNLYGPYYPNWSDAPGSIDTRRITVWSKAVSEDTWVSIIIKMKLSRDKNVGEVELWFNGEKQTFSNTPAAGYSINLSADKKTAYHKTFDGLVTYPKWGAYNGEACNYETYTYYDEMRIGKDLASVLNPLGGSVTPPPSDATITSVVTPKTSFKQGEKIDVQVKYTTAINQDVVLMFQLDESPWTLYKEVRKSVNAGSTSTTMTVDIPLTTPILTKAYQFQVYLTPPGGNWSQKVADSAVRDLSVQGTITSVSDDSDIGSPSVFPNPSNDGLFNLSEESLYEVVDLQGHLVSTGKSNLVNLSSHPKGIYILKVGSQNIKLIK